MQHKLFSLEPSERKMRVDHDSYAAALLQLAESIDNPDPRVISIAETHLIDLSVTQQSAPPSGLHLVIKRVFLIGEEACAQCKQAHRSIIYDDFCHPMHESKFLGAWRERTNRVWPLLGLTAGLVIWEQVQRAFEDDLGNLCSRILCLYDYFYDLGDDYRYVSTRVGEYEGGADWSAVIPSFIIGLEPHPPQQSLPFDRNV